MTFAQPEPGAPEPIAEVPTPESPWTLERLKAEHPDLVAEVEATARAEYLEAHPAPAAGTRALIDAARERGATAERTRILAIVGHAEATGRRALALRLAGMPGVTVEAAGELLAGVPRQASGPEAEFAAVLAKARPAPPSEGDEVQQYLARVKALDEQLLAERQAAALARAGKA